MSAVMLMTLASAACFTSSADEMNCDILTPDSDSNAHFAVDGVKYDTFWDISPANYLTVYVSDTDAVITSIELVVCDYDFNVNYTTADPGTVSYDADTAVLTVSGISTNSITVENQKTLNVSEIRVNYKLQPGVWAGSTLSNGSLWIIIAIVAVAVVAVVALVVVSKKKKTTAK